MTEPQRQQLIDDLVAEFPSGDIGFDPDDLMTGRFIAVQRDGRGGDTNEYDLAAFDTAEEAIAWTGSEIMARYPWVPEVVIDTRTGGRIALNVQVTAAADVA